MKIYNVDFFYLLEVSFKIIIVRNWNVQMGFFPPELKKFTLLVVFIFYIMFNCVELLPSRPTSLVVLSNAPHTYTDITSHILTSDNLTILAEPYRVNVRTPRF